MDKQKIGEYLKNLRKQKKNEDGSSFSQNDLANEFFLHYHIDISINAIAEWEGGKSLPSPEKMEVLSKIYGKTIDEILDGEDRLDTNYKDVYFISDQNWGVKFDDKAPLYQIRNEQIKKIVDRFKELISIRINRSLSFNEENEFRFLFDNFYILSDYAKEYSDLEVKDDYLIFKDAIFKMLIEVRNMSFDEQYWEVQKLYTESKEIQFTFRLDVHDLRNVDILQARFNTINNWQKDMLLAMFQNIEPFDNNPGFYGPGYLKRYEEQNGIFEHDEVVKTEIRELINRGACLDKCFFNVKRNVVVHNRIIDRLEELYDLCLKPIEVHMSDNEDKVKSYKIENNMKNRFMDKYYFTLLHSRDLYDSSEPPYCHLEELYQWFISNEEVSDDIYKEIAKKYKIDTTQDKKYWLDYVKRLSSLDTSFKEFKAKEKEIEQGLKEIETYKAMLKNGETYYSVTKTEIIGGTDEESIREYVNRIKSKLVYDDYLKGRDKNLTNKLLSDLDKLSLPELKEKYFGLEVIANE